MYAGQIIIMDNAYSNGDINYMENTFGVNFQFIKTIYGQNDITYDYFKVV